VKEQVRLGVTLGELLVALPHHVGQVAKTRNVGGNTDLLQGQIQSNLAGSGGEQVFPAQHVSHPHQGIIDRVHKRVERFSPRTHPIRLLLGVGELALVVVITLFGVTPQ
jgi:hypothetical protein